MLLNGKDLAEYIKQRHFKQVQSLGFSPVLAIIMSAQANAATRMYVKSSKSRYSQDIGATVEVHEVAGDTDKVVKLIGELNNSPEVQGIIVQLPFADLDVDKALAEVNPSKDIDGLNPNSLFEPATPKAILWLLSSYAIEWKDKTVVVVGQGRVVGKPLADILERSQARVVRCDIDTSDLASETLKADIVVTAAGVPSLIRPGMVRPGAVIIDAGTTEMGGNLVGDVDHSLYDDETLKLTPNPGGVGPMTVAALFDNLLQAASNKKDE
jgi:methylenetetrahydrofolate dehydrogenase (NADP+) / methenyltetrahydrofolate cyclohydrolase